MSGEVECHHNVSYLKAAIIRSNFADLTNKPQFIKYLNQSLLVLLCCGTSLVEEPGSWLTSYQ